jgi:GNAT superfamily N-acetyltransferase
MLLARLAVDHRWQGQGVGQALLRDALLRTLQAADIIGIRAFAVSSPDSLVCLVASLNSLLHSFFTSFLPVMLRFPHVPGKSP